MILDNYLDIVRYSKHVLLDLVLVDLGNNQMDVAQACLALSLRIQVYLKQKRIDNRKRCFFNEFTRCSRSHRLTD